MLAGGVSAAAELHDSIRTTRCADQERRDGKDCTARRIWKWSAAHATTRSISASSEGRQREASGPLSFEPGRDMPELDEPDCALPFRAMFSAAVPATPYRAESDRTLSNRALLNLRCRTLTCLTRIFRDVWIHAGHCLPLHSGPLATVTRRCVSHTAVPLLPNNAAPGSDLPKSTGKGRACHSMQNREEPRTTG